MSAPLPPVPNVVKAAVDGLTSAGKLWLTLFHFAYTGAPPSAATLNSLASLVYNEYLTEFIPLTPPSASLQGATVTDLSSDMANVGFFGGTSPGTSTADKLPANCATLFNANVSMHYRGGHPRNYVFCGTDENLQDQSHWNAAYIATATSAMVGFLGGVNAFSSGGITLDGPVMVSYFGGAPTIGGKSQRRAVPIVLPETDFRCNPMVGSQRRRRGTS